MASDPMAGRKVPVDPLIHSLRWVKQYPMLSGLLAEIWSPDFDPVKKWVKPTPTSSEAPR